MRRDHGASVLLMVMSLVACAKDATPAAASAPSSAGGESATAEAAATTEEPAAAQGDDSGALGEAGRLYDTSTVETQRGQVARVDHVSMPAMKNCVHVVLTTETAGEVSVHLGPASFVEQQSVSVAPGDTLEVTGSRVMFNGEPALLARTVKKGDAELVLRDQAGVPMWSGRHAGR